MKNSNLLNRLLSYSHEKQSPQRFARYAVMLIMLLTLGVGQMWADSSVTGASIKYDVNASTAQWWNVSSTPKDLGQVYTFTLKGFWAQLGTENVCQNTCIYYGLTSACSLGSYNIKDPNDWSPSTKHFQTESMNVNILSGLTPNKYTLYAKFIGHGKKSGNDCGEISSSTYQMKFEYPAYLTGDGTWCGTEWNTTADAQKMTYNAGGYYSKTVSSVTQADHKLKVSTYNWASSWGHAKYDATNSSNVYSESNASGNIQFQPAMAGDVTIKFNISDQKISIICTAPTITLDDEGGSGGDGTQNTYYNVATSNVSVPTRTGYIFEGYYDGDDGTGNQIINASGVWQKNKSNFTDNSSTPKWIVRANHTLHAKWTPVTWKLQSTLGDHGTFTGTGPYTLDVTYNSATMNWGAARFDLNGTSYICNNYPIGTSEKLDLRAANAYTAITGMTNGRSYTFTITYENATWYVQIEEAAAPCTTPTIAWNTTPANGVAGGNMTASVTTNQTSPTITWNSSNTSAATVNSSGVITYVAAGNTRITASYTGDGSTYCSTTASVYQDITVSAAVADAWSLWYWGESETKIGDFTPDGGDSHHLDFELTASNFQTLWLKNNSTQYVATNINANTVTNVTVTESPVGRFRDDATKGYYRFTIYKDGGGAWKLDASPIYRVIYNDNGATSGTAPTDAAGYVSGATVTVKGNTGSLAKTGYDFGGWNLAADGSETNYTAGSGTFSITANTELFAKWNAQNYSIIYKDQGDVAFSGSHVDSPSAHPTTHTYGTATTLNSATKTGYTFGGWFDNPACTGVAVISLGATTYSDDITLYAKWTENMTTVTINANPAGAGTFTVDASAFTPGNTTTAGVATSRTVVTTAQTGYKFSSWGTSGNATGTSSTNTYTLKGNGSGSTGTLTANFSRLYAYVQGRFQVKDAARSTNTTTYASDKDWDESSTNIPMGYDDTNHRFVLHTHSTPSELSAQLKNYNPYFYIKTSTSNSSLANTSTYWSSSSVTLSSTGYANGKAVGSSGSNANLRFNSETTSGYAVVYFDQSKIWYELEYRLQYNANGGSGTAPTGANGHNSYHATGTNATAEANTFTARKNYTFAGWNTAADITGTSYAAGASVPMSADRILYAKWNRSVTLDQQDATTPGSTSVTATWNCSTLPSITNPQKLGYEFGGWYTETAGNGNIIINTSGQLQASKTNWTVDGGKFQRTPSSDASESKPLYAKWTQMVTLNANLANHGSGDNTSATIVYKATAKTSITHCTPASGYHLEGYYTAATDGVKVLNADGSFASSAVTDYITDGKWTKAGATTLYAHYEPNTYDVILDVNGATSGSDQTVVATFDDDMPTTQKTSGDAITAPSKTGYTFGGYWTNAAGTGTQYYTSGLASSHVWDVATNNTTIYAKWTANPYTITLTQSGETGYGSAGTASVTATYDAALPTISSLPTAANGYAFMGYYTDHNGEGTQYYDATGTKLVATYTTADALELFAYFKKAEITNLVASPGVIAPGETITITPTIDPTPVEPTIVCWEVQYSNGTPLPSQPTFTPGAGNAVSFPVPSASATYIIQAVLKTGSTCGSGTELSRRTTTFQVAGAHDVTVKYMCGDLTIKASEVLGEIRPLTWSDDITAPTITGYTFARWDAGDGVTIKDDGGEDKTTSTSSTIKIKAVYDGTLTAVYNKKNMIFFNNTLNWEHVYVYFYKNSSYWDDSNGAGTNPSYYSSSYSGKHGEMTQIDGTSVYYFDASDASADGYSDVAFTEKAQDNCWYFYDNNKVIKRGDYNASKLPMFVPLADQTPVNKNGNTAKYYDKGYWMNYPENTGYTLKIYNAWNVSKETGAVQSIAFPYSEDKTMPLKMDVELSDGYNHDYWFMIYRNDGVYLGGTYHFKQGSQAEQVITGGDNKEKITTSAPGDYTFTLTYHDNGSGTVNYYIDVDFPIATGDYRIYYSDNATWSKAAHTKDSWYHPSHSIGKATTEAKKDTISFFIPKGVGISHTMKFQKASVTNEGVVTWADVDGGGITIPSSVNATGVYNFIVSQPAGGASISLEKVEPYTGNYYIRTDCAGSTKWDSFKNLDHQMTYSDYAEKHSGYSHYYTHWVTNGTNVKFCIANDYSQCITDTLTQDYGTVIANIDAAGALNSASANIRFMWNQSTNKVSRAYIGGSTNISDRFLVLEGDSKMYDKDGSALNISGLNPNEANLIDDQNFVYEREIQVNTKARAKLTAKYNTNIQYFKGSEGAFAEGTTIELLGGDATGKHTMRIVYDFKTNRLVTAYVPSGTINADIAINADLMIVREHQGAGQQLLFEEDGALSKVHTVYGVMRFNRWTLNNKEKTGEHSPVGDPKSIYERSLYWISFPFDVNLSDVFGFGTYGVDWIIEYYDGAERATNGYWIDSDGFWKMVMPAQRADFTLEAGKGYVLAIDVDAMKDNNTTFWANNIEQVELFFPSAANVENITQTTAHTTVPEHECTIDRRTDKSVNNINKDRTKADSHWNMIGVPSYANYNKELTDGSSTITWHNPETEDLPFLYEWNMTDDSYTVQSGTTYPFKAMHAYMVQYHGDLYWSLASATPTPSPIVARRAYAEKPQNAEFRLELQQNEKMVDQTFVNMKDAEEISAGFKFDEDLCKEFNAGKANIYTLIENYLPAAGNTLPMSEQTTLVPVGVKIAADGEYTFAIPEGTEGIGVVLIDNIAGTRTNLGLMDYSVTLEQGQIDNRFLLEISPIVQSPTGIELLNGENGENGVRKVLIDNILYIVKDGIVYDAQGHRVQ